MTVRKISECVTEYMMRKINLPLYKSNSNLSVARTPLICRKICVEDLGKRKQCLYGMRGCTSALG